MLDWVGLEARVRRLRTDAFYYIGALMIAGALLMFLAALLAGQLTWPIAGIVAANIGGGGATHLIGRWLRARQGRAG